MPSLAASTRNTLGRGLLTLFSAGLDPATGTAPQTYGQMQGEPPKKSNFWLYLLGGCGCSVVLVIACCGGFTYFGYTKGMEFLATALRQEVADNPAVKDNLGEISSLKANVIESAKEKQDRGGINNWLVFDAVGTKGSGKFITETPAGGGQGGKPFSHIELRMSDGKTIDVK